LGSLGVFDVGIVQTIVCSDALTVQGPKLVADPYHLRIATVTETMTDLPMSCRPSAEAKTHRFQQGYADMIGGIIGSADRRTQLGSVAALHKLRRELVEGVGLHSSQHMIHELDLIAGWPGDLGDPPIGIHVIGGEERIHVLLKSGLQHKPYFSRVRILLQTSLTPLHTTKALSQQIQHNQDIAPD